MSAQQPGGQPQGGVPQRTGGSSDYQDYAKFGVVLYLGLALGSFLFVAFVEFIGDEQARFFSSSGSDALWNAATGAFQFLLIIAPLLAVFIAVYYYQQEAISPSHVASAVAAAAGAFVAFLALLILATIFEADTASIDIGAEIVGLLGGVIGLAATAALTAFGLDNYEQY